MLCIINRSQSVGKAVQFAGWQQKIVKPRQQMEDAKSLVLAMGFYTYSSGGHQV